jgi:hypothetical protein
MQANERQLHLGRHPGDPGNVNARGLGGAVIQQRRLSYSSLTTQDQSRALPSSDLIQQPAQFTLLRTPTLKDK